MEGCAKCMKGKGWLILLAGVLLLLVDLQVWDLWGISWWTLAFILCGVGCIGHASCKACQKK